MNEFQNCQTEKEKNSSYRTLKQARFLHKLISFSPKKEYRIKSDSPSPLTSKKMQQYEEILYEWKCFRTSSKMTPNYNHNK